MLLENAKGTRDISPEDQILRQEIITLLQQTYEKYGFIPIDTPIIERYDVLSAKFAAGEESDAMSETYKLKDNGNRELGLRFDLTVPLARYVGSNHVMKMPFKRYQIGKVYRDAPIKFGRYREFTQCDADIIGSNDMLSDVTCIQLALEIFEKLGIDIEIKINNRKLFKSIIEYLGVKEGKVESAMMTLDKLDKLSIKDVQKELESKKIKLDVDKFLELSSYDFSKLDKLFTNNEGLKELKEIFSYFKGNKKLIFDAKLARGFSYYTGSLFEIYSTKLDSALGGGGRYDDLISGYLSGNSKQNAESRIFPAVGISFGLDRIVDVIKQLRTIETKTKVKLFVIPIGTKKESFEIANKFREAGINTDIDLMNRKLDKNMKYAQDLNISFVVVIGENEIKSGKLSLKDMDKRETYKVTIKEAIKIIIKDIK
ncbi:MAG: histidine--tRNA ligase [Candidatus Nanoarchaeia archaeon]|nr:histidine--tRNA ligase [Candidatus Nanoarchaeia archaeon]